MSFVPRVGLFSLLAVVCLVSAQLKVSLDHILLTRGSACEITITYNRPLHESLSVDLPVTQRLDGVPPPPSTSLGTEATDSFESSDDLEVNGTKTDDVPIFTRTAPTNITAITQDQSVPEIERDAITSDEENANNKLSNDINLLNIDAVNTLLLEGNPFEENATKSASGTGLKPNGIEVFTTSLEDDTSLGDVTNASTKALIPLDANTTLPDGSSLESDTTSIKVKNTFSEVENSSLEQNITSVNDLPVKVDGSLQEVSKVYSGTQNMPNDLNTTLIEDSKRDNEPTSQKDISIEVQIIPLESNKTSKADGNKIKAMVNGSMEVNIKLVEDSSLKNEPTLQKISNASFQNVPSEPNSNSLEDNVTLKAETKASQEVKTTLFEDSSLKNEPTLQEINNKSLEVQNVPLEANSDSLETISTLDIESTTSPKLNSAADSLEQVIPIGSKWKRSLPIEGRSLPIEGTSDLLGGDSLPESLIMVSVNNPSLSMSRNLLAVNDSLAVQTWQITLYGDYPGNVILMVQLQPTDPLVDTVVVHVDIERDHFWSVASTIIGWIYFVGWGLSAHCQVYVNWKRQSVVGLNFDYLGLNMIGHTLYGVFNVVLFFSTSVQKDYFRRNPMSANPIQINDVVFSVHNSLVTLYTVYQCFKYERGKQRLSNGAVFLYTLYGVWLVVSGLLVFGHKMQWLDFINQCALIKLSITLIKYAPQAYMNYRRKSTVGWSIGNVLMDFIGGLFSLLQMIILAYNFDDWHSFLTDTTKLGLAVFTLMFDVLFIVQHYVLYREIYNKNKFENSEPDLSTRNNHTGKSNEAFKSNII